MKEKEYKEEYIKYMTKLIKEIKIADDAFHFGEPIISEAERDRLHMELEQLEQDYGILPNSPTLSLGGIIESKSSTVENEYGIIENIKISRSVPMLSMEHTYNKDVCIKKIEKLLKYGDLIIEPKIDGVALAAVYEYGFLSNISLRGDGYIGENVMKFAHFIGNLPENLNEIYIKNTKEATVAYDLLTKPYIQIRGEVITYKTVENKRNYVAGFLRRKVLGEELPIDINELKNVDETFIGATKRKKSDYPLYFIPYDLMEVKSHTTKYEILKEYFDIPKYYKINKLEDFYDYKYLTYDFPIDGIVIKLNEKIELGSTNRYYKNLFAYKAKQLEHITTVTDIIWTMQRDGRLTPICIINPIIIDSSKITRVSAHNYRFVLKNNIGIESKVSIERVGNVIPKIVQILCDGIKKIPSNCYCGADLIYTIHIKCTNINCEFKKIAQVSYFFTALNIPQLGRKMVHNFIKTSVKESLLYFKSKTWIKTKNDHKAFYAFIKFSKTCTMNEVIHAYGLGINLTLLKKYVIDFHNLNLENIHKIHSRYEKIKEHFQDIQEIFHIIKNNECNNDSHNSSQENKIEFITQENQLSFDE